MTIEEAIKIREHEEAICHTCAREVCRICSDCWHNSHYMPLHHETPKDETLDNYRSY